jgi:hypothetical protein
MTDSQRLTYLKIGAAGVIGLLLLDSFVISPAITSWGAQTERIDALRQKVQRGQQMIDRQEAIRAHWAKMVDANLPAEVSAAESASIQAIDRWARVGGISFTSRTPQWQNQNPGYQTLEWRASATGTQAQLSRFIYEMETDSMPVSLEEFEITTRDDRGAILTMTARFSFLRMNISDKGT